LTTKNALFLLLIGMAQMLPVSIQAGELKVAVASNFTDAARDLVALFEKNTGHNVKVSFGSSGKLYTQIKYGAPFDVFLAADSEFPKKAIAEGMAINDSRFTYATGKLVLWSANPDLFEDAKVYLRTGRIERLAIANPKTAPYGRAAQQVLQQMGLWNQLHSRLVRGDSIAQTFQFVATRNAAAGFIALSQALAWKNQEYSMWLVPQRLYEPLTQQGVLLNKGLTNPVAAEFLDYLKQESAVKIIQRYGYSSNDTG
jgi:molybdate transport system substrate-binding protein